MQKYNLEWFRKRAFECIRSLSYNTWDFSDSLLWYADTGSEEKYVEIQMEGNLYNRLITSPEEKYLQEVAKEVVMRLPRKFEYIDLGPGTAGKEKYFFEEAQRQDKTMVYRPVDISKYYLDKAAENARSQFGLETKPLHCSFEELPEKLENEPHTFPRFVSMLGLTFHNFYPHVILELLKEISGNNGIVFVDSQLKKRVDVEELTEMYDKEARILVVNKLKLIGIEAELDSKEIYIDNSIKFWFTIKNVPERLTKMGIKSGDKLLVFQSLRPTEESLKKDLDESGLEYEQFDTGSSFVGTLLRTK